MGKTTPTKEQYQEALETVKKYEGRQEDLTKLNKELGFCLQYFDKFKFDINVDIEEVTFTGVMKNGELKLTKAKTRHGDKFEDVIGKLTAVKKAIGEDVEYLERYIEQESLSGRSLHINPGMYRSIPASKISLPYEL